MPKRVGHIYDRMLDKGLIRTCIMEGAKGKKKDRWDVKAVLADVDYYVEKVYWLLENDLYIPTKPKKKRIYDSSCQKERDIKIVPYFPDGIIQRVAVAAMQDVIMRGMYHWSCASIPGRGNIYAANYVKKHLNNDRKGTKYAGKFDIYHYYPSVNRRKLIRALWHKIKDKRFLELVWSIINSDPEDGLSIGFYLNQWLANFFLESLDHFICTLDGVKYYVRNMDDIIIMGPNKKKLRKAREAIARYLESMLWLKIKGNWQVFRVDSRGIDFVGYRFFHNKTILRKRNFQKIRRNSRTARRFTSTRRQIPVKTASGLLSRSGQLKHCDGQTVYDNYVLPITEKRLKTSVRLHMRAERSNHVGDQACNK